MKSGASGFVWYELMTAGDLDTAASFYAKVVGWDVRDSGMPGMRYMLFGRNGKDVGGMMSWASMKMNSPTTWKGHIHTTDVNAETAAVVAGGGTQHRPPTGIPGVGRFSVVSDPQGAEYLLFQPAPVETPPSRLLPNEIGAVGWHELGTSDWEKAWEFYSARYGWEKGMAVDMGPMGTYQTFMTSESSGGGMMTLPPFLTEKGLKPAWLFYFTVDDIQAAAQRITENGGTITHGPAEVPGGAWIIQAVDPQGGGFAVTAAK